MDMITAGGGEIYACKLATDMFKLEMKDLSEHVKDIITIGQFYELADGDRTQIIFT
jgi:peroxiredoxin family protein